MLGPGITDEALSSANTATFTGRVELKAASIAIRVVVVQKLNDQGDPSSVKVYMSTDTEQSAEEIVHAYRCRFQQEFIFRDAKQFSGLEEGQARDWLKIDFHLNASMTVVNLAKVAHHLSTPVEQRGAFSMSDITTAYVNERLALRILGRCGIDPNLPKMKAVLPEVRNYATKAD